MLLIFLFLTLYFSLSFSIQKNIYVNYNDSNVPSCRTEDLSECGDSNNPFSSIMQMFYFIDLNSESLIAEYDELNIFFLSPVYIVDSFNVSYYLRKLNQTDFPIWQVFKKISGLQINMRPSDLNKPVLIAIKTILFSFQINDYTLNLENINFNCNDITFRLIAQNPCLYWKIGCCVLFPNACSLILSTYSGYMTHIFEIYKDDGIFLISNCKFTNMKLKRCLLVGRISYCSNGFLLIYSQFSFVKIENSYFEKINYVSFFIGTNNLKNANSFYGERNFIWKNNTLIEVNWGLLNSENSTFLLTNMNQVIFIDSYFDSIFDFLKISNSFDFLLENNIFIQKTQKSSSESNNYLSISSYFINVNNNIINDILVYMNLLHLEFAFLSIFNLSMSNILYTWDASLIKIFGSKMNLKNLKILLYPESVEYIYTINIQANVLISQNMTIVNQNKNIPINMIFQNIQKIWISDCKLTEEGSIIKLSNFIISFFYCNHIMASKLLFYGGVSISIDGKTKYVLISDSRFSLGEEDSISLFQFEKTMFIQFKYVFFESFSKKIKWPLIYLNTNNNILIEKCYFFEITNMQSGGLIQANSQNKIKMTETTIFNVKSFDNGGSILIANKNVVLLFDNNIINSNTLNSGGFLNAYQNENIIFAKNTSFILGVAADGAGFYLNYNSSLRLENVFLANNTAAYNGGTIKLNFYSACFLFNVKILHSSSLETGGIISMLDFNTLILRYCLLENIISESGGVFSLKRNNVIFGSDLVIKNVKAAFTAALLKGDSLNIILFRNITTSNLTTEIGLFVLENNNKFYFIKSKISDIYSSKELISLNIQNILFFKHSSFMNDNQNSFVSFFFFKGNLNLLIFQSSYLNMMLLSFVFAVYENKLYLEQILLNEIVSTYYFMVLQTVEKTLLIIKKVNLFFFKNRKYSTNTKSFSFFNVKNSLIFIANFSMQNNFKNLVEFGDFYNCKLFIKNVDIFNFNLNPNLRYFKATYCWIIIQNFNAINVNFLINSSYFNVHKSMFSLTDTNEKVILFHFFHEKCFPYSKFLNLKISHSIFVFNKVKSILMLNTDFCDNLIMIKTSFFRNNFASNGPAINAVNLKNLLLMNNYFIFNRAKCNISNSKGGVFYFETQRNFKYFTFINNKFIQNSANIGGVFFLNGGFPYIDEKEFRKNNTKIENSKALYYGQDFATNTIRFALEEKQILISNLVSGRNYTKCLAFVLISDFYGNYAYKNNEILNSIVIKNEMNETISNSDNWLLEDGFLCFKGYLKNKGSSFENIYSYNLKFLSNFSTEVLFSYSFRPCKKGERLTNDYICVECPRNFYSFKFSKNEISTCSICGLDLPFFCFGGNNITIKYSYWRKSTDSTTILKCPNDDACIGDTRIFDDSTQYDPNFALSKCAKGYTGPLCAICEKGFGFSDNFFCVECSDKLLFVKLSFFFLIQLFFSLFTIYKSLCTAIRIHKNPSLTVDTSSTNLLKILSNHAAILIIIFSLNESPLIFNSIFEGNPFNFNLSDKFTLECIFKLLNIEVPFIYSKILITILSPIFILIISILFFQVFFFQRKKSLKTKKSKTLFEGLYLRDILQPLIFIIISLNIPHLIRDCLSMFVYQNIGEEDNPDFRLKNDYSIIYDSDSHKSLNFFLALPLLISCSFLFPFLLLLKLWIKKSSHSLYEQKNLLNFAFFFYSYNDNAFYWDIFTFFRRLFIQVAVIFSSDISFQSGKHLVLLLILSFHLITIFLLLKISPYKTEYKTIHSIEESSLLTLIASTFFFLIIIIFETDKVKFSIYTDSLVVVIIIFNLGFYVINFVVYVKSKKYMSKLAKELFGIFKKHNLLKKTSYKKTMDFNSLKLKKFSLEKLIDTTNTTYDSGLQKYLRAKDKKNQNLKKKIKALTLKILELNHLKSKNDMRLNFKNLCFNGQFYKTIFKNADFKIKAKYSCKIEKSIIYKFKLFFFSTQAKLNQIKTRICNKIEHQTITLEWNKMENRKYFKTTIEIECACLEVFPEFMIEHWNFSTKDWEQLNFEIPVPLAQLLKKEKIEIVHDDSFDSFRYSFMQKSNCFEFVSSKILLQQILVCYEFEYLKKINNTKILLHFTDRQMNKIILYFCLLEKSDKCKCFILNADSLKKNYLIVNNLKKMLEF